MPKVDDNTSLLRDATGPLPFMSGTVVHSRTEFMVVVIIVFVLTVNF